MLFCSSHFKFVSKSEFWVSVKLTWVNMLHLQCAVSLALGFDPILLTLQGPLGSHSMEFSVGPLSSSLHPLLKEGLGTLCANICESWAFCKIRLKNMSLQRKHHIRSHGYANPLRRDHNRFYKYVKDNGKRQVSSLFAFVFSPVRLCLFCWHFSLFFSSSTCPNFNLEMCD